MELLSELLVPGLFIFVFLLVPFAFVLIIGGLGAWYVSRRRAATGAWKDFADDHGFEFEEPGLVGDFEMSGRLEGAEARACTTRVRRGWRNDTYTLFQVGLPDAFPSGLSVRDTSRRPHLDERFDGEVIQVGEPEIDRAFTFRGDAPEEVREFFERPGVRDAFRNLGETGASIHIDSGDIAVLRSELQRDRDVIERAFQVGVDFERAMERALRAGTGG